MKYNILITDILIKDFVHVYKKDFGVDCLWKLESKIDFSKYQGIVVTGGFSTNKQFLKNFKNELNNLWIHGLVHLFGHDHKKEKDFLAMKRIEKKYSSFIND